MYDILQLNDMLVPELLDIAEDLNIENPKKLDKQGLIYKILDKQAVMSSQQKAGSDSSEKPKRKRIVKASTANSTEEAVVENMEELSAEPTRKAVKKVAAKKEIPKKGVRKKNDEQPEIDTIGDEAPAVSEPQPQTTQETTPIDNNPEKSVNNQVSKFFAPRREQNFNIEFDGVIMAEGV